jgi:hypothetical protein
VNNEYLDPTADIASAKYDAFIRFTQDNYELDDYQRYELAHEELIVRVFKYVPDLLTEESEILNEHGIPLGSMDEAVLPFGKVLAAGSKTNYSPGEIVLLPDSVSAKYINPEFQEWKERIDERPKKNKVPPSYFAYGLDAWDKYIFLKNKFKGFKKDDELTFLLPAGLVKGKYRIHE